MIVKASLSDAADCADILLEWVTATKWFTTLNPESASITSMKNRIETGTVVLKKSGYTTLGFIAFSKGYLDCLYLRNTSQNQGLGVTLLNFAKQESQGKLALWVLAQNHAARRFYMREGFAETGHGDGSDNEENLPDVRYEWCKEVNKIG